MSKAFSSFIPLLFYFALGVLLHVSHGQNHTPSLFLLVTMFALSVIVMLGVRSDLTNSNDAIRLALAILMIFHVGLILDDGLIYAQASLAREWLDRVIRISAIFPVLAAFTIFSKMGERIPLKLSVLAGCSLLIVARVLVLFASPRPFHDTVVVESESVDFLLRGINPYSSTYTNIYKDLYPTPSAFWYPPGALLALVPFRLLFHDVRSAFIVADVVVAFGLWRLALKTNLSSSLKQLVPWLWLAFPPSLFMLEQAWIDTLLVAQISILTLLLVKRDFFWSGLVFGWILCTKQSCIFMAPMLGIYLWRREEFRNTFNVARATLLSTLILIVPFAIWDWAAFNEKMRAKFLFRFLRTDSLSIPAYLYWSHHFRLNTYAYLWIYLVTLLGLLAYLATRSNLRLRDFLAALVAMYGVVFLFGKAAFCNYYLFLAGLVLMYIVSTGNRATSTDEKIKF